jgi:hypothetical protein
MSFDYFTHNIHSMLNGASPPLTQIIPSHNKTNTYHPLIEINLIQSIPFQRSSNIIKNSMNKYVKTITFPKISSSPKLKLIDYGEAILLCKPLHFWDMHQFSSNHVPSSNSLIFATRKNGLQEDLHKCLLKMISTFLTRWCLM